MRLSKASILGVLAMGCGSLPPNQQIQEHVALNAFEDCAQLEQYIEDQAVLEMKSQLEQTKKWGGGGPIMYADQTMGGPAAAPSAAGPSAYTTTNTQVAGVDEADFVKNDGTRIFVLSGDALYLNQSWPADQLRTVGKQPIEGWPQEMFLDGNTVIVFSSVWSPYPFAQPVAAEGIACSPLWCGYYNGNTTKLTVIDVTDMSKPRVTGELYEPGSYASSRRIGDSVRVILSDQFRYPLGVQWWPDGPMEIYQDKGLFDRAVDALEAKNEKIIRDATIEQWLPRAWFKGEDGQVRDLGYSCREFSRTNAPTKLGIVTVATLNLTAQALAEHGGSPGVKRTSIIAESGQVYSSQSSLYVASQHWWWWPVDGLDDHTYLHKFDLSDPTDAVYVASGGIDGFIVDQFSMDESDGYFRVATTARRWVQTDSWWGTNTTTVQNTNRIFVLSQQGKELKLVGRTEPIGPSGESIRSARFMGPKGYVVTARYADPFFTFDLSDPANPRAVGEFQVPGWSSYLHPIDANTVLALGEYTNPNGAWNERAVRLSLYDVSDFAHPREAFTQLVGTAYGYTDAMWDHKAFNYFPQKKLLAIPFWDSVPTTGSYWDTFVSDLRVFGVDPATGFTSKGSLDMRDVYVTSTYSDWSYYWSPEVRRSVMADDYVYAISDGAIRVANVNSLSSPIKTTLFDRAVTGPPIK